MFSPLVVMSMDSISRFRTGKLIMSYLNTFSSLGFKTLCITPDSTVRYAVHLSPSVFKSLLISQLDALDRAHYVVRKGLSSL